MKYHKEIWQKQAKGCVQDFREQFATLLVIGWKRRKNEAMIPQSICEELMEQAFLMGAEGACNLSEKMEES